MNNDFDSDEEQEKEQGTVRLLTLFIKGCVLHWRFKNILKIATMLQKAQLILHSN